MFEDALACGGLCGTAGHFAILQLPLRLGSADVYDRPPVAAPAGYARPERLNPPLPQAGVQRIVASHPDSSATSSLLASFRTAVLLALMLVLPLAAITGTFSGNGESEAPPPMQAAEGPQPLGQSGPPAAAKLPPPIPPRPPLPTPDASVAAERAAGPNPGPVESPGFPHVADAAAPLSSMQQRLRDLGASHYVLEKWGNEPGLYRFHCEVPLGQDADHCRYFEATDARADRAVGNVLREVEHWQAGRYRR